MSNIATVPLCLFLVCFPASGGLWNDCGLSGIPPFILLQRISANNSKVIFLLNFRMFVLSSFVHFVLTALPLVLPFQVMKRSIDCGYSLEPLRRGRSYEWPHSIF